MDGGAFDDLTRRFAGRASRRRVLSGGASTIAAAIGLTGMPRAAAAARAPGEICRKHGDCASGVCGPRDRTGRQRCLCAQPADCPGFGKTDQCRTVVCTAAGTCDTAILMGQTCDPANLCVTAAACDATGACVATATVECPPAETCFEGGCNPLTGACEYAQQPNGTACEDGNLCTGGETCQDGRCIASTKVTCPSRNPCEIGNCNPATGGCDYRTSPDGAGCDDGDPCTTGDTCQGGVCVAGASVACPPPGLLDFCVAANVCNPATGACEPQPKADGEACFAGTCCGGRCCATACCAGACCPSQACRTVSCDAVSGQCVYAEQADGTRCGSGGVCCAGACCEAASGGCFRPTCTSGVCGEEPVPHGQVSPNPGCGLCCNGACQGSATALGGTCCAGGGYCPLGFLCCGETCCQPGTRCCGSHCCAATQICCGATCCLSVLQICVNGQCQDNPDFG